MIKCKINFPSITLLVFVLKIASQPHTSFAAAKTWDGGGNPTFTWSTGLNWDLDAAPSATVDTLTFGGIIGLANNNNLITALAPSGTALTFASGAGSFVLSGNAITMGSGGGAGQVIIQQNSANNQEIAFPITLSGGNGDRQIVFGSGTGSLTLSGNLFFNNDWLFPTTTAGTIILSGNNTGDGKGTVAVNGVNNTMRAMMRNNVSGTQLSLGSDTCLGNVNSGSIATGNAAFRGVIANQNLNINTTGGSRNLSGNTLAINAANIIFNGANNLTIGDIIVVGGNRDFVVSSSGQVTVQDGICLSADQTGRNLFLNLSGAGGMVVNGKIYDTFHSGGLTTAGSGTFRKAGAGMLTLNGNSSYADLTTIEAGTLRLGNANALGTAGTSSSYTTMSAGTLDLNGITTAETLNITGASTLSNSSGTAGGLSSDANLMANLTVDATGDISTARLIGTSGNRTITKNGAGTLTTSGSSHNNLSVWQINQGTVVFANTSGYGADRGVTINGGTLKLSGANSDLINDGQSFMMNGGILDLNGKGEAVAAISGSSGATIRNSSASTATLFVGGGVSGSSSASFAGLIENGVGTLNLTKEGSGIQTLTGANTYTGSTTISAGTLLVNGSLASGSAVTVSSGGTLGGSGTVSNAVTVNSGGTLAPGTASIGTLTLGSTLSLAGMASFRLSKTGASLTSDQVAGSTSITADGTLTVTASGDTLADGNTFTLFNDTPSGTFTATNLPSVSSANWYTANNFRTLTYNAWPAAGTASYTHNKGISLKIAIADLLTHVTGAVSGKTITLTSLGNPGISGASLANNGNYILYTPGPSDANDSFTYTVSDGRGGSATGTVNVVADTTAVFGQQSPQLTVDGSGNITVTFHGIPGYTYVVQRSTDLNGWADISIHALDVNDSPSFTITDAPGQAAYYRLKWQP
jgi:autotransporter-associated beta strand protein